MEKNSKINKKFIIQINISTKKRIPKTKLMYEIVRMDRNLLVEDVYNNEIIYDINLEYLKNELYNKDKLNKEEKRLLIFIEKNKEKLKEVYKGDIKMRETVDNLEEVSDFRDISFALEYDKEALDEQINKEWMEEEIKEGIEKGIEERLQAIQKEIEEEVKQKIEEEVNQKVENTSINIAKEIINRNIPKNEISEITKLSLGEINKLIKNN